MQRTATFSAPTLAVPVALDDFVCSFIAREPVRSLVVVDICVAALSTLLIAGPVAMTAPPWGGAVPLSDEGSISVSAALPPSYFGNAIAFAGNDLAIGCVDPASLSASSAGWVEVWVAQNKLGVVGWTPSQLLAPFGLPLETSPGALPSGAFGSFIAAHDDWLFVAQPFAGVAGTLEAGLVHAYRRGGDGRWTFVEAIGSAAPAAGARLGQALSFDGTTLAIGYASGVRLVTVAADGIGRGQNLVPPSFDGIKDADWGSAVAVDGPRLLVAAAAANIDGANGAGAVVAYDISDVARPVLEGLVTPPNGAMSDDAFGTALSVSGNRLAVAAAGSDKGAPDAGTVFLYDRDGVSWAFQTEILGLQSGEELGSIALDGDVVAIGSPAHDEPATPIVDGGAWIYRISGRVPELLAQSLSTDVVLPDARVGRALALDGGRWAYSLTRGPTAFGIGEVRIIDVSAAGEDCNDDGIADGMNVTAFNAPDCNTNLVPDECELAMSDCDGNEEIDSCQTALHQGAVTANPPGGVGWGLVGAPNVAVLFLVSLEVPYGTDEVLRGIAADWFGPSGALPAFAAVYTDPDQNGHPDDAALVAIVGLSPSAGFGMDFLSLDPLMVGPAGTRYFVGLGVKGVAANATSMFLRGTVAADSGPRTFTVIGNAETLDVNAPGSSRSLAPLADGAANVWCAGLFRSLDDRNGDSVPDSCECIGDLNRSGTVDPLDLGILLGEWNTAGSAADLDGSGLVGPSDLGILLGAWGPC